MCVLLLRGLTAPSSISTGLETRRLRYDFRLLRALERRRGFEETPSLRNSVRSIPTMPVDALRLVPLRL